ncbi:TonB-dependent receptor [Mesorhizobium sp. CGMCC 1.15528]|uniref:TonB-dependent receptor n=2 Tax=Mesorhizobium zhangyense TaxID=1776730 RepID=A0A7C9R6C7_9HYPH|nr:TonB-dependent receptor [Mesorhizobium zhangyense]
MGLVARNMAVLLGGAAVTVLVGTIGARAQETNEAEKQDRVTQLERVVITSGRAGAGDSTGEPEDVPASVGKVDKKTLEKLGRENLDDVLRSVPGTFTRENPQQPGIAVNIRGFEGSGRVNSMIDGVRQSFRFTGHEAGGFTYVDPNFLTEIDVERGAVSTAGGGGLAGSVNFRTIGVEDIVRDGQEYGLLGRASWGSNGVGFSEMLAGGVKRDAVGLAAAISKRDSNDFKNGDGETVPYTGQDLVSGLLKADFGFGEDHRLSLGSIFYQNDFTANSYEQQVKNRTATANYRYDPTGNDLIHLKVNGYYNDIQMEYLKSTSPFATSVGRKINDRGVGFDVSNTSLMDFGEIAVKSENGVEYFTDKVTSINGGVNPANAHSRTGAVFSENTFTYGMFELVGALRYDFYNLDGTADAGPRAGGAYTVDQSKGALNPKVTLAVKPLDWFQPYVTYSQSMRAPTVQETMVGGDHPGGTSASFLPNPDLKPESQKGWEVGVNVKRDGLFTADDSLRVKASYYNMKVEDFIAARFNPQFFMFEYVNVPGEARQSGIELAATYDLGLAFGGIAYTHTDTKLPSQQPGLGALSYLPDDIIALTLGGRFLEQKLEVGTRVNYVSNGVTNVGNANDPTFTPINVKTPSYTTVDLFTNYKVNENVDVAFKVTNLFDKQYTPALSTIGSGQGRTFHVSTQFQF